MMQGREEEHPLHCSTSSPTTTSLQRVLLPPSITDVATLLGMWKSLDNVSQKTLKNYLKAESLGFRIK